MLNRKNIFLTITVIFTCFLGVFNSEECRMSSNTPNVEIIPASPEQMLPVGKPATLWCKLCVSDISLVSNLRWLNASNSTIEPKPKQLTELFSGEPSAMYTDDYLSGDHSGHQLALVIPSVMENMDGMYICTAVYARTEVLQQSVKIRTYVPIAFDDASDHQYSISNTDYKVKCMVSANPAPIIDWLWNNETIKSGGRYVIESDGLLIRDVQELDDGVYSCRATVLETDESVQRDIRVEVLTKPKVDPLPTSVDAVETQPFSIKCNATGNPAPEYLWIKDSTQDNVLVSERFQVNSTTGLMTIKSVELHDYDTYTCLAYNTVDRVQSQMQLNICMPPKIIEFYNLTISMTRDAQTVCKAVGLPPPDISFRRFQSEEELQHDDVRIILKNDIDQYSGLTVSRLTIKSVSRSDDGLYECVARNPFGSTNKVGHITIEYPPSFEHYKLLPPVYSSAEKIANLSCFAQSIPNSTVQWQLMNGTRIEEIGNPNLQMIRNGLQADLIIRPLSNQYYSAYKCIAQNQYGRVEHLMELRPWQVPSISFARARTVTPKSITFEINPEILFRLPILSIHCQFQQIFMPDWSWTTNLTWLPDEPYIVDGLRPQETYNFRFAARNAVGLGHWGAYVKISTPRRSVPHAPKILHTLIQDGAKEDLIITSPFTDQFELSWTPPYNNGEEIDLYEIKYCPVTKLNDGWNEIEGLCTTEHSLETSYKMNKLQPGTYYQLELRAHNLLGYSVSTDVLIKTTGDRYFRQWLSVQPFNFSKNDIIDNQDTLSHKFQTKACA